MRTTKTRGPKSLQFEVGARRTLRLLVFVYSKIKFWIRDQDLFFFLNLPLLTSLSCFWKALLVKPMLTFLEQIFLASCLYNRRPSTTSFHCLHTSSAARSSLKLRCRKISSRTSGLRRASGWNKTTQVESDPALLVSDAVSAAHKTSFVEVFEVCVEVSTGLSFVSSELPLLAISQKGLTHKLRHLSPRGSLTPP